VIAQAGLPRRLGVSRAEPDRRATGNRRSLHDDKSGASQRLHDGDDASHNLVGAVRPLATVELQRVRDGLGDVVGLRVSASVIGGRLAAEAETKQERSGDRPGWSAALVETPSHPPPLMAPSSSDGEIDYNIDRLKDDLDAVRLKMKKAIREQAKKSDF
jgi:hypothetical protein